MIKTVFLACLSASIAFGDTLPEPAPEPATPALAYSDLVYSAPGSASQFHHVLEYSMLQASDSTTVAYKPCEIATEFFHLEDDTYLTFQVSGEERRSELRQTDGDKEESAWSVRDYHRLQADVSLPKPAAEMQEFTFLQMHCTGKPALRVEWMREYDGNSDAIVATLRMNAEEGDDASEETYFLGTRSADVTHYDVTVEERRIVLALNEDRTDLDVTFWEDSECYFKAGMYIEHSEENDDVRATAKFAYLWWE